MAIFLDPTGNENYGIGICQRCSFKFFLNELHSDPNTPGLKVCVDCLDDYDPYRLAPRQADRITLPFYRPEERLTEGGENPQEEFLGGLRGSQENTIRVGQTGRRRVLAEGTVNQDEVV